MVGSSSGIPVLADALSATERIAPYVHRTPVLTSKSLNRQTGKQLFFKCENLQKTGSFKCRGAVNAVYSLGESALRRGVVTHSSGNHGLALAYAAASRGTSCTVVVPDNAVPAKVEALMGYGGKVIRCKPGVHAREKRSASVVRQTGAELIHPFDDKRVIAGQASCALELLDQVEDLEAIAVPVGGGGLMSGTLLAAASAKQPVTIFATEPRSFDTTYQTFSGSGDRVRLDGHTIADGLRVAVRNRTRRMLQEHSWRIVRVSETAIRRTVRIVFERMKLVIEPSSAVPLAAVLSHAVEFSGFERIGIVFTGGNVDLDNLQDCLMVGSGNR